jgi:hypothetical protein
MGFGDMIFICCFGRGALPACPIMLAGLLIPELASKFFGDFVPYSFLLIEISGFETRFFAII